MIMNIERPRNTREVTMRTWSPGEQNMRRVR